MGFWLRSKLLILGACLVFAAPTAVLAEPVAEPVAEPSSSVPVGPIVQTPWAEAPISPLPPEPVKSPRIIAIGDLHGDHEAFRAITTAAGLIDSYGRWIGGDSILVQTGDVPDRGPSSLLILQDLMRLQNEAAAAGGRVVTLMGNHEAMNVIGDLRYVHEGEFAAFRTEQSRSLRRQYYREHQDEIERAFRRRERTLSEDQIRRLWVEETPLGGAELLMAWSPEGEIGQWLVQNPAVVLIDGTLFAHGGISEAYASMPIAEINARAATAIATRNDAPDAIINDDDAPLWYRGYFLQGDRGELSLVPPEDAAPEVDLVLAAYGAQRIVVGHTPSLGGIRILLDGRLIAIDTGISAHYGGVHSYLEIRGDTVTAHTVGEEGNP